MHPILRRVGRHKPRVNGRVLRVLLRAGDEEGHVVILVPLQLVKRARLVVDGLESGKPDASTRNSVCSRLSRVAELEVGVAEQVLEAITHFAAVVDVALTFDVDPSGGTLTTF